MNIGAYGKTQDGTKFTTVGFVKEWYDLSPPDGQTGDNEFKIREINSELSSKEEYLLAIYYDDQHPERNDMFLAVPDEVSLISNLTSEVNDYLLNKDRLSKFLKAMEIDKLPDKNDSISLTKRCVGMKILVEHIECYGEKIASLFEESFRDKFINFLLQECSKPADRDSNLKCDWYDQKLYAIKKLATESQNGLSIVNDTFLLFNEKMMSLTTQIEGSDEQYSKCFKLKGALNYGCVAQKQQFKLIEPVKAKTTPFRNDNIVVLNSSDIDTTDKILEYFEHVDVIVTSDLDLKETHTKLKETKKDNITYFKSIVLLDDKEFDSLQEILTEGPKINIPLTSNMSEHDALMTELQEFCGFSEDKLKDIFKDKENESLSQKVSILSQACKQSDKEEKKNKDEKEEDKKEENDEIDTILSRLENNSSLRSNLNNLSEFANNNYNSQNQSSFSKGELFSKAYAINSSDVIGTYKSTLAAFYKQLCRKTISSFFEQLSLEKLLSIILTNEENFEMFLKYIQIRGNEAVKFKLSSNNKVQYEEFLSMFKKILEISSQREDMKKLLDTVLNKVIIEGTAKILDTAVEKKATKIKTIFDDESAAVKALNIYLIPDAIKYLIHLSPEAIFNKESYLKLITILLMIPITFREEKEFHQNVYMSAYKLILPFVQEHEKYNDIEMVNGLLNLKFLKNIFEKLPTNIDYSYNNLTNEQKVLFEIYLLMRLLEEQVPEAFSNYNYPDCVLDLEKSKQILKEMKNFDLISYLIYYKNDLSEEERSPKITIESHHNRFNHKFRSKHQYNGFKKMKIELDGESVLDSDSTLLFSKDPEGLIPIKAMTKKNIENNDRSFDVNATSFYLHYPYNPHRIKCFGYGYNYKLGNNE